MTQDKIRVVVFDLDDTLYRELNFLKSAYRELAGWLEHTWGIQGVYDQMLSAWQQHLNAFAEVIARYRLNLRTEELIDRYRRHVPDVQLDTDTRRLLALLHDRGCILGIITDGRSLTQRNKIAALGLSAWFSDGDILISGETGYEKPAPQPYRFFMDKYPDCTYYYIGDNPAKDFLFPNRLGWTTVCLLDDGTNVHPQDFHQQDGASLPQHRITNITQLENIIYG